MLDLVSSRQMMNSDHPSFISRSRLSIVISHPIQHFCPVYRSITDDGRVDLLVIFAERGAEAKFDEGFGQVVEWQKNILEGYNYKVLKCDDAARPQLLCKVLQNFKPDVVCFTGYNHPYLRQGLRWAKRRGIRTLMQSDSELKHHRPWYVQAAKRLMLPLVLRQVDRVLTTGDENEKYFKHYGMKDSQLHRVPFSIDSDAFDRVIQRGPAVRQELRARYAIPNDAIVILSVGKLVPYKGHADLLRAFTRTLGNISKPTYVLIAGEGSERQTLEALALPITDRVLLPGFIKVDDLIAHYAASDIYVHPSSLDAHPLSISEAAYCGLPIIASDKVGSVGPTDDVQLGGNGWTYQDGNVQELSDALTRLIQDEDTRRSAGATSQSIGRAHASKSTAKLFIEAAIGGLSPLAGKASESTGSTWSQTA